VKSAFVLAPLVFALRLTEFPALLNAVSAGVAFSLAASTVYIINDIVDRERDRLHPKKRYRPIAAGAISLPAAWGMATVTAAAAAVLALLVVPDTLPWIAAYLVLNMLYSTVLKRLALVDVLVIAIGFVLRVETGSAAIGETTSSWMVLATLFIALFLGLAKRRGEEANIAESTQHRPGSELYTIAGLDILIGVSLALTIIAYALYTVDSQTIVRFGSPRLVYTVPLVILGLFRYFMLITRDHELADPTDIVTRDIPIIATVVVWALMVGVLIYGPPLGWFPG